MSNIVARVSEYWRFLEVLKRNTWFIYNIDPFLRPLYRFRCQLGPFSKFAFGPFSGWGRRCFLPGCCTSEIFDKATKTMSFSSQLNVEHGGDSFVSIREMVLETWTCKSEILPIFGKLDLWPLMTGSIFDLGSKNAGPFASTRRGQSAGLFRLALRRMLWKREGEGCANPHPCAIEDGEMASAGEG